MPTYPEICIKTLAPAMEGAGPKPAHQTRQLEAAAGPDSEVDSSSSGSLSICSEGLQPIGWGPPHYGGCLESPS